MEFEFSTNVSKNEHQREIKNRGNETSTTGFNLKAAIFEVKWLIRL
ncbi:MAG: hypothetical protein M0P66_04510 [Salinivirgaceae bacterium]|nr:hypothetical protein [Salinivirgaceae bacterium]